VSIALVMTVRDEVEFLRSNLLYHHHLGVDIAYVYEDGSTDGTPETVADLPFVRIRPTVKASSIPPAERIDPADEPELYTTTRQNINTGHALGRARADGMTWLLAIDADELACVDMVSQEAGALARALDAVPQEVEAVILRPLEIVQRRATFDDTMAQETLFKRADVGLKHLTFDPFTQRTHSVRGVYGHTAGKSAVRLSADLRPETVHRFRRSDGSRPTSTDLGWLLHYFCYSFEAFVRKFYLYRDHPDRHLHGHEVQLQKRLWRDVVNKSGMSEEELRDYYQRWVMFDDHEIARLRRRRWLGIVPRPPAVVEVTAAKRTFAELRSQPPALPAGR
jgi:hypothetical protein